MNNMNNNSNGLYPTSMLVGPSMYKDKNGVVNYTKTARVTVRSCDVCVTRQNGEPNYSVHSDQKGGQIVNLNAAMVKVADVLNTAIFNELTEGEKAKFVPLTEDAKNRTFVRLALFDKRAEAAENQIAAHPGVCFMKVSFSGSMKYSSYTDKNGVVRGSLSISVDWINFLGFMNSKGQRVNYVSQTQQMQQAPQYNPQMSQTQQVPQMQQAPRYNPQMPQAQQTQQMPQMPQAPQYNPQMPQAQQAQQVPQMPQYNTQAQQFTPSAAFTELADDDEDAPF